MTNIYSLLNHVPQLPEARVWFVGGVRKEGVNEPRAAVSLPRSSPPVAQKVVAMRKKQQLSIGPCKSLPNSPSHSSVPAASIPSVHLNQVRSKPSNAHFNY